MNLTRTFGFALACGLVSTALPAQALITIVEHESNDTRLGAQFLNTSDTNILVRGSRRTAMNGGGATADWYRFNVSGPSYLSLSVGSVGPGASSARLIYGLYDNSGTMIGFGGGPTSTSGSTSLTLDGAGSYYVAVMGWNTALNYSQNFNQADSGNFVPTANSSWNWDYQVSINYTVVPEPSEWAAIGLSVLGIGGLMLRARKKTLSSLA